MDNISKLPKNSVITSFKDASNNGNINILNLFEKEIYNKYYYNCPYLFFSHLRYNRKYDPKVINKKGIGQLKLFIHELFFLNEVINSLNATENLDNFSNEDKLKINEKRNIQGNTSQSSNIETITEGINQNSISTIKNNIQTKDIIILYIGSAPGHHIYYLFDILRDYNFTWHLWDPRDHIKKLTDLETNEYNKIKIFKKLFERKDIVDYTDKNVILISDLRTVEGSEPSTKELLENFSLQNDLVQLINPLYVLLKWSCPWPDKEWKNFYMINGLELLQVYSKRLAVELRITASRPYTLRKILYTDAQNYEEKMFYFNTNIRNNEFSEDLSNFILENLNDNIREIMKKLGLRSVEDIKIKIYE